MNKYDGYLHDFANKLTIMSANCFILNKIVRKDSEAYSYTTKLKDNIDELNELFVQMRKLNDSGDNPINITPINMRERLNLFRKKIPAMEIDYGIQIILDTDECSEHLEVYSSTEIAQRISINCIENAARANASKIVFKYTELENALLITLTDNGEGMTTEELDKIGFGKYSTSGGGQGVSIIRDLVSEINGIVEYSSKKGFYTEVKIKLNRVIKEEKHLSIYQNG
jgi:two-component system sporulation sensor kinase B